MAPVAQSDIDLDSRTSSPQSRQISEPLHAPTTSTAQAKCPDCGEYFEAPEGASHDVSLKEHIATVHPHLARHSTHDDSLTEEEVQNGHGHEHEHEHEHAEEDEQHLKEHVEDGEYHEDHHEEYGDDAMDADELDAAEEAEHADDGYGGYEDDPEHHHANVDFDADVEADSDGDDASQSRRQFLSAEKRLYKRWNIHDVRNFSLDYDEVIAALVHDWDNAFSDTASLQKRNAIELPERPDPYKKARVDRGNFLEMTPIEDFLVDLRDPEKRSPEELYAITENAAHALATWQDEYFAVDSLYKLSIGQYEKLMVDPRKRVEDPDIEAEKKEALLYQYKYDAAKRKKNQEQDPWIQGGFRPTPTQVRKALKTTKFHPDITPNIDGWRSLHKFGIEYVPKYQDPPPEDAPSKATRTRKAAEMEAAAAADEARQAAAEEEDQYPAKRQTRSTRAVHEAVGGDPSVATPPQTPSAKGTTGRGRGRGTGRGRGRGRGGMGVGAGAGAATPSGPPSETSTPAPPHHTHNHVPTTTRGRGRGSRGGGRGRGSRGGGGGRAPSTTPIATPQQMSPAALTPAPTSRPSSVAPTPSQLAPLEPRPNGLPPMVSTMQQQHQQQHQKPAEMILDNDTEEELDPAEIERRDRARAEKIANSKNPRRTEAMLNHWARFNRAGRIRNPKRSKDEIEAARSEAAVRKATVPPKASGRKRKSPPLPGSATLINAGIAPAPGHHSHPGHLGPGPSHPGPGPGPAPGPAPGQLGHPVPPGGTPVQPPASGPLPLPGHPSLPPTPSHHPLGPGGPLAPHPQPRYTTPYPSAFGAIDPRGMGPFPPGPFQPPPPPARYQTPYPPDYFLPFGGHGNLPPPPPQPRRPT